jgi:hypothetical protein
MPTKQSRQKSKQVSSKSNRHSTDKSTKPSGLISFLLALTLVPSAVGAVLLIAWALDLETFGDPERLPPVAFFFLTLGFFASNALQKRWILATGWGLMGAASLLLWISTQTIWLVASFILGIAGLIFLGYEFFKRIAAQGARQNPR